MNKTAKIITAAVSCAAAVGLCIYAVMLNRSDAAPTFSNMVEPVPVTQPATLLAENWADNYDYAESPDGLTERARIFLKQNPDIAGWISIDNTKIDFPFVLDPGALPEDTWYGENAYDPNSYYLDHDLDKSSLRQGTVFMDYRDVFGASEEEQSDNIILYGHNMANNTAFGSLRKYRQDYSFFDESPFIDLSSNYKDYQYVIFGFIITSGNWYSDFRYWDMEEFETEDDFNTFVERIRKGSLVDTGVDVKYGDKLVTLSTCYAAEDNSRFIVCGRRLREGEIPNDMSSITRTPEYLEKKKQEEASIAAAEAEEASREAASKSAEDASQDSTKADEEQGN